MCKWCLRGNLNRILSQQTLCGKGQEPKTMTLKCCLNFHIGFIYATLLSDVVTFIFCLNHQLGVIYTCFMEEMGFKVPCWGFMVLSGTFQAPGHLIPGQRNSFPWKVNSISGNPQILENFHSGAQDIACFTYSCCILPKNLLDFEFLQYFVPFSWKRVPWAWD